MNFEFYDYEDLDRETVDSLWKQGVCMDDWDYVLFFEAKYKSEFPKGWDNTIIEPTNYNVARLLNGCCKNQWWPVTDFMGKKGFLGVAYHA